MIDHMPPNNSQPTDMNIKPPRRQFDLLLIPTIALGVMLLASLGFGFWAYTEMQDYKNNTQEKIDDAVAIAKQETATAKDNEFLEKEKIPHKTYQSADALGTIFFEYPKTWSAFMTEEKDTNNGVPIDGYLHPDFVPGVQSGTDFALRVQVASQAYNEVIGQYESKVKQGKVKIFPFKLEKVPSVLGVRVEGEIEEGQVSYLIALPVRDKTLLVWTESTTYLDDFNKIILPTLSFVP